MKKFLITAIAALGMISAAASFADALNGAAGKKLAAAVSSKEQARLSPVDVLVLNRSENMIRVQNGAYVYTLGSGDFLRLPSNNIGNVPLYLTSAYDGRILLNSEVCHRAIVIVRGRYSNMASYLDNTDCFKK